MTTLVEFLADRVYLLPVAVLLVLLAAALVLAVGMALDSLVDRLRGRVGAVVEVLVEVLVAPTLFVSLLGSISFSAWLSWRVLTERFCWVAAHPIATVGLMVGAVTVACAVMVITGRNDEMAFWQLAEFADEFTDDEIAGMPKKHQRMVHTIRAHGHQPGSGLNSAD